MSGDDSKIHFENVFLSSSSKILISVNSVVLMVISAGEWKVHSAYNSSDWIFFSKDKKSKTEQISFVSLVWLLIKKARWKTPNNNWDNWDG